MARPSKSHPLPDAPTPGAASFDPKSALAEIHRSLHRLALGGNVPASRLFMERFDPEFKPSRHGPDAPALPAHLAQILNMPPAELLAWLASQERKVQGLVQ